MKKPLLLAAVVVLGCSRRPVASDDPGEAGMNGAGIGGMTIAGAAGAAGVGNSGAAGGIGGAANGGTGGIGGAANGGTGGIGGAANGGSSGAAGAGSGGVAGTGAGGSAGVGGTGTGGMAGGSSGRGGEGGVSRRPLGQPCLRNDECATALCVDGVCCNTACTGACVSCGQAGALGQCQAVPANVQDPRGLCAAASPATCGHNGTCDGAGACRNYAPGTVCAADSCKDAVYSPPRVCDGNGTCLPPIQLSCVPYKCNASGSRCQTGCLDDTVCTPPTVCRNLQCQRPTETPPCTGDEICASGHCAQGVCCATACQGPCNSCAMAGSVGICTPVSNPDPSWSCPPRP